MRAAAVHRADHGTAASFSLVSEFASIRLSLDTAANGPRVLLEDLETGAQIHLDPLELASLCRADEEDRVRWLRVGVYRDDAG
jgi:hypothetical protein